MATRTKKQADIVLDGNQEVVTDEKVKAALLRSEKAKAAKSAQAPKTPKPKVEKVVKVKPTNNPSGHAWITAQMVVDVFKDAETMKYGEIATKHNISVGSVSTILSGPKWFVDRFTPRLAEIGVTEYPQRAKKSDT
jgi:hypothetical protein